VYWISQQSLYLWVEVKQVNSSSKANPIAAPTAPSSATQEGDTAQCTSEQVGEDEGTEGDTMNPEEEGTEEKGQGDEVSPLIIDEVVRRLENRGWKTVKYKELAERGAVLDCGRKRQRLNE